MTSNSQAEPKDKYFKQGVMYAQQKKFNKAIKAFTKSIEKNPGSTVPQVNIIYCYLYTGNYKECLKWIDELLIDDPDDEALLGNKASCLKNTGQYNEALEILDKLLMKNPENQDTLTLKGNVYWQLKKYDEAISYYKKVVAIDPSYTLAWQNWIKLLEEAGRKSEIQNVISQMKQAVRQNPELLGFKEISIPQWQDKGLKFFDLGSLHSTFGEFQKKIGEFLEMQDLEPNAVKIFPYQERLIAAVDQYPGAWNEFQRATNIEPITLARKDEPKPQDGKICANCGTKNKETSKFCGSCGSQL